MDDTPHTACTPASLAARGRGVVTGPAYVPGALRATVAAHTAALEARGAVAAEPEPAPIVVSTRDYRRETHGHAAVARRLAKRRAR